MAPDGSGPLQDDVYVLMESYKLIKEEVNLNIRRYDSILSLMPTIALALFITIRQYKATIAYPWIPFLFIGILAMYAHAHVSIQFLSSYLVALENKINEKVGDDVLVWEKMWVDAGLFYRWHSVANYSLVFLIVGALYVYSAVMGYRYPNILPSWAFLLCYIAFPCLILIFFTIGRRRFREYKDPEVFDLNYEKAMLGLGIWEKVIKGLKKAPGW